MFTVLGAISTDGTTMKLTLPTTYSQTPGVYKVYVQNSYGNDYANAANFTLTAPTSDASSNPNEAAGWEAVRQLCATTHWPGCTGL